MRTFNYKPARYSVIRIEQAKQRALTGREWSTVQVKSDVEPDWNADDEEALCILVEQWDKATGHQGLNDLIDDYEFSHGTQFVNSGLKKELETVVYYPEGRFLAEPQVEQFVVVKHDNLGTGTIQYKKDLWRPEDVGMGDLLQRGYKSPTKLSRSNVVSIFDGEEQS